jgi:uncharacterized protein YjdB
VATAAGYLDLDTLNNAIYLTATAPSSTFSVIADSQISGGSLAFSPESSSAGTMITVTVTPDSGYQLISGSLKYSADGGSSWTAISETGDVYSFALPAATTLVTAGFKIPVSGVNLDKNTDNITAGSTDQLTAMVNSV